MPTRGGLGQRRGESLEIHRRPGVALHERGDDGPMGEVVGQRPAVDLLSPGESSEGVGDPVVGAVTARVEAVEPADPVVIVGRPLLAGLPLLGRPAPLDPPPLQPDRRQQLTDRRDRATEQPRVPGHRPHHDR